MTISVWGPGDGSGAYISCARTKASQLFGVLVTCSRVPRQCSACVLHIPSLTCSGAQIETIRVHYSETTIHQLKEQEDKTEICQCCTAKSFKCWAFQKFHKSFSFVIML